MNVDATSETWTSKVLVLSDLHLVPEGGAIHGIDPAARLQAAIETINRKHADAALLVILGDLVDGGDEASYRQLRRMLGQLALPCALMIGNHDHRASFVEAFGDAHVDENRYVQSVHSVSGHRVILLDTVPGEPDAISYEAGGSLCALRLAWLDAQLEAAKGERVLLMLHHPPMQTGFRYMDRQRLANASDLLGVLRRHGNVQHIFAGHIHRTIGGSWHGIPFSIFKSPVHQQPMDLDSDACLSVDEPGALGIVLLTPSGAIVHADDDACRPIQGETVVNKLNFWDAKWDLDEKQCPCDIHLLDYLAEKKIRGADIFHMGTGSHHIVGLRTAADGSDNHVFGITSSPQEHEDYVKLLIDNPRLGFSYKVYFGDIYQINRRLMPELDIATLFHIGEFRTHHNEAYGALGNVDMTLVLADRLRPGGELIFYAGSFAYDQAEATIKEVLKQRPFEDAGLYKTLHILKKRGG